MGFWSFLEISVKRVCIAAAIVGAGAAVGACAVGLLGLAATYGTGCLIGAGVSTLVGAGTFLYGQGHNSGVESTNVQLEQERERSRKLAREEKIKEEAVQESFSKEKKSLSLDHEKEEKILKTKIEKQEIRILELEAKLDKGE